MSVKVSVVVPVYNVAEFLAQCLDTILLQTLQDIEVICVDDGSTDGSLDILNTYAFLDSRLKVIHQENAGAGTARNRGLKEATGEFIMFLDSDDFFEPEMLEKMVAKAEEDGSDVVVAGHYIYDNNLKQKIKEIKIEEKYLKKSPAKPEDFGKELFILSDPAAWNKLIRLTTITKNKLFFDERVHYIDDVYFTSCALACATKISVLSEAFLYYRTSTSTQQTQSRKKYFLDALKTLSLLYESLEKLYGSKFLATFCKRFRYAISWMLQSSSAAARENLSLIHQELPAELFSKLFLNYKEKVLVSIIIPVYNAAEFLPECLDSCLNQTLKEIEIICVDDGSTDNSLEILNEYAKRDGRVIVLQQENQRQAVARNKAMEVATGRYIQFLDADDYLEPDACECLYLYSDIFGLEMCQCTAIEFYHHNKKEFENPYHCLTWLPDNFQPVFNRYAILDILPKMAVTAWLTFYRHDFLIRNNITWINKKIAYEDTPFFTEAILKAKRVGAFKAPFYHRRVHSEATTQQMATNFNEYMEILKYTLKMVKKLTDKNLFTLYCATFLQKAWGNFAQLEPNDKINMASFLYDFCYTIQQRYHLTLPPDIYSWSLRYLNTLKKNKKEKLRFKTAMLKTKCIRNEYYINLIKWQREPILKITLLGLPILYSKNIVLPITESDKKNNQIRQKVFIKFCGLTILKIQEAIHV